MRKQHSKLGCMRGLMPAILSLLLTPSAQAFPPALHHTFFGLVRDEYGNPITSPAQVFLTTDSGAMTSARVIQNLEPGVNYRLAVPMDAGLTSDLYKPTALRPTVPFKLKVKISQVYYVPIEMNADFSQIALPGETTRINLTLGVDSDGDGLPDAWETALIALRGKGGSLADINPGDDTDGDGLKNIDEYVAGAYAFDSKSGFALKLVALNEERALFDFTAVRGRAYFVESSEDFKTWQAVEFTLAAAPAPKVAQSVYQAKDTKPVRIEVNVSEDQGVPKFFRLMLK